MELTTAEKQKVLLDLGFKRETLLVKNVDQLYAIYSEGTVPVTEIFYSIEGEGTRIGEPTIYLRFNGCPEHCSFCDSRYSCTSNDRKELLASGMLMEAVVQHLTKLAEQKFACNSYDAMPWIEFTGGSPDWYPVQLGFLCQLFSDRGWHNILQVSGGIWTEVTSYGKVLKTIHCDGAYDDPRFGKMWDHRDLFNLAAVVAADYKDPREHIPFVFDLHHMKYEDEIKFLIRDDESYDFVKTTIKALLKTGYSGKFIITTVTSNDPAIILQKHQTDMQKLVERILNDDDFDKTRVKLLFREHVLLWGTKRGV